MALNIAQLEQDWLAAESAADQLRAAAMQADAELEQANSAKGIKVTIDDVEQLHARHAAAEKAASDAFDRLWSAKTNGS